MKLSSPIEIIKKSIDLFFEKKNFAFFIKVYLPLLPFALFSIVQSNFVKNLEDFKNPWIVSTNVFVNLGYLIVYFWISIAGIMAIKQVISGQRLAIRELYIKAWKMMWRFSLLSILLILIMLFGGILLIFPAIVLGVWYSFSRFIFIEGEVGILRSLGRSKNLVVGRFWKILGRYIVFGLATILFGIIVSMIPLGLGEIITTIFGALFVLPYYLLYLELSKG